MEIVVVTIAIAVEAWAAIAGNSCSDHREYKKAPHISGAFFFVEILKIFMLFLQEEPESSREARFRGSSKFAYRHV